MGIVTAIVRYLMLWPIFVLFTAIALQATVKSGKDTHIVVAHCINAYGHKNCYQLHSFMYSTFLALTRVYSAAPRAQNIWSSNI